MTTFSEIVDAADDLSLDQQQALVEILRRRIATSNRAALVRDVEAARQEYQQGGCRSVTAKDLMDEARNDS